MGSSPTSQAETAAITDALAEAAATAGHAPSVHDTQPWRWELGVDTLDLYLERGRILDVSDPDTRLATLSCGAALHHARVVLAAKGWHATVEWMPNAADNDHLAHLRVDRPAPVDALAVRLAAAIPRRHTDRRPVAKATVDRADLDAIATAVQGHGAWLRMLAPDQVLALVAAADTAHQAESANPAWQAELAYWSGGLAADRAATFAILYGGSDEPRDWIRAGEALSAGWLTATERGVSLLPLSAPVEVAGTRDALRRLLAYLHHPYLVVRLGRLDPAKAEDPPARRRPTDQTIARR